MRRLRRKLRSPSGETLTETLCALLVVVLSSVVLATMVGVAGHMNASALERDGVLYQEFSAAEAQDADGASGKVTVQVDGEDISLDVTYYGGGDALTSYAYEPEGGGGG